MGYGKRMKKMLFWLKRTAIGLAGAVLVSIPAGIWLWQDRDSIEDIDLRIAETTRVDTNTVTVTWLGTTTLLFDDGETQILIDGFISRPNILDIIFHQPLTSDAANINYAMDEFKMRRLAAIIPVHSHHHHAMDVGAIANRSSASIIATNSTINIVRNFGVPDDQIIFASNDNSLSYGKFTVTLINSRSVPDSFDDNYLFTTFIPDSLQQSVACTRWHEAGSWSILISHPNGTTLVQGSTNFIEGALAKTTIDVVMLGIAGLNNKSPQYAKDYWQQIVEQTRAKRVYVIHHDDFTQPFGQTKLFPNVLDDVVATVRLLNEFAKTGEEQIDIQLPSFGQRLVLY
jgi:L-ascorbate metabolism protein UlaG (beta-lactamase superfamily)